MEPSKFSSRVSWTFGMLLVIAIMVVPLFGESSALDSVRDPRAEGAHSVLWFSGLLSAVLIFLSGQRDDWPTTARAIALVFGIIFGTAGMGWAIGWF